MMRRNQNDVKDEENEGRVTAGVRGKSGGNIWENVERYLRTYFVLSEYVCFWKKMWTVSWSLWVSGFASISLANTFNSSRNQYSIVDNKGNY